ncbi:hypothetical protein PG994_001409 [Apiospora phragmitis]|uniref:Uncharacterized protein n=1 Tax=Apiospora phragmitis TaxID=2905665 RepID=A0ABR1WTG4_9PEZI
MPKKAATSDINSECRSMDPTANAGWGDPSSSNAYMSKPSGDSFLLMALCETLFEKSSTKERREKAANQQLLPPPCPLRRIGVVVHRVARSENDRSALFPALSPQAQDKAQQAIRDLFQRIGTRQTIKVPIPVQLELMSLESRTPLSSQSKRAQAPGPAACGFPHALSSPKACQKGSGASR